MSHRIWKYPLAFEEIQDVKMPAGSMVVHVAEQQEQIVLWALVDTAAPLEVRRFKLAGTGHEVPSDGEVFPYLGTAVMSNGYVWHVFDVPEIGSSASSRDGEA